MIRKIALSISRTFLTHCDSKFSVKTMRSRRCKSFFLGALPFGSALVAASWSREGFEESSHGLAECSTNLSGLINSHSSSISDHYNVNMQNNLGTGNYSTVCKGIDRVTGEEVAVKRVLRSRTTENAVFDETSILSSLAHRNIIKLKGLFNDQNSWYIVMELARGEELFDRIVNRGLLNESETSCIMQQLIGAVAHLHENGIIHGDIKPENCILDETDANTLSLKLADFGSAFSLKSGRSARKEYTVAYSPPEVISGVDSSNTAGDIWALGVIMYILLTGTHPFDPTGESGEKEISYRVLNSEPDFSGIWESKIPAARDLARRALSKDPKHRPTAKQMLKHSWIQKDM